MPEPELTRKQQNYCRNAKEMDGFTREGGVMVIAANQQLQGP